MDNLCDTCRALASSHLPLKENKNVYTKILLTQRDDHEECMKVLLEAGAEVNATMQEGTALVQAARRGQVKRLQALIMAGADVNQYYYDVCPAEIVPVDCYGCQNALVHACITGNSDCVGVLIQAGANVNKIGHTKKPVLLWAFHRDNVSCVDLLIKAGAHVNSEHHHTPLYYAIKLKANRCIDLLLRSGADVRKTGLKNVTALMLAKDKECCRLLLKHHSQINRRDRWGNNALKRYMMDEPINKDICSLLFAAGETVPKTITRWFTQCDVIKVIDYLPQIKVQFYLKQLCREVIRKHLLKLDRHTNLFDRIPRLGFTSNDAM